MILRSPFGRVLAGIRVNEHRMLSLGYPTFRYKLACFVIAGAIAGVAGYLSAVQFGVVNPEMLGWHLSAAVMMMVILGGMGTLVGPAIGAAIWMLLELGGIKFLPELSSMTVYLLMAVILLWRPEGIYGRRL